MTRTTGIVVAFAALGLLPSAVQSQTLTLQLTTSATIGANSTINASSLSIPWDSSQSSPTFSLPDVLHTVFNGNGDSNGLIDLNFNLIVGPEILTQTGTYTFSTFSNTGPMGAIGADSALYLNAPIFFNSEIGTFKLANSYANTNLLGKPVGSAMFDDLFAGMSFVRVPEPSTFLLSISCAAIGCFSRHRRR